MSMTTSPEPTSNAGVTLYTPDTSVVVGRLEGTIDLSWAAQYASEWLEALHLNDNQGVFSVLGMPGIIQPRLSDENGRGRLINTGDLETSALLAVFAINYLPNRQKVRPPGLSDTQWNMALHLLNQAAGGEIAPGELNDVPKSFGIDLSTSGGLGELEVELSGKPSAFDEILIEVSEEQYIGILSFVRTISAGNREWVNERVFEIWRDAADDNLTAYIEHLQIIEKVHADVTSVDFAEVLGRADRGEFISSLADGVAAVRRSGQGASSAVTELRGMLHVGRQVDLGRLTTDLAQVRRDFASGGEMWVRFAQTTELAIGVLIQYGINNVGSAVSAMEASETLRKAIQTAYDNARVGADEVQDLYLQVGRIVKQIVDAPDDGHHPLALARPSWLQK